AYPRVRAHQQSSAHNPYVAGMQPEPPPDPSNSPMTLPSGPHPEAARMEDERRLIGRAQSGDTAAFRELVERHQARAYTLALRILRSAPDAEEVSQDAFVRAWTALPGFRGEASFATWVYRIVARRAFDRAQILKNRRAREQAEDSFHDLAAPEAGDDDSLRAALLQRLVASLSPAQRAAVTMFYYE